MSDKEIYDSFLKTYQDYPKELFSLIEELRPFLPANIEDENYNLGTMEKDKDLVLSSNMAIINAHSFEKSLNIYKEQNPQMPDTEAKARVVFDFLNEHGVDNLFYEKNKDDILFRDNSGNSITREQFYANAIYNNALTNTNFFDRNVGNIQILCLEPKSITATPRNIEGLPQEKINSFMNIPDNERLEILYKRGLYHESIHMALGTSDERKCDAFALLKMMKEHPNHAKAIFDIYNIQRSKMGYTISTLHKKNTEQKRRMIKGGAITYLMPNTYKKLEQYALNPQSIPDTDAKILKLTCELTSQPEFSKEQLSEYAQLISQERITPKDLANNKIVQSCMQQGGFINIEKYITCDNRLNKFISTNLTQQQNILTNNNKEALARCRKKLAKGIDNIPETNLTNIQFPQSVKKFEKTISEKFFDNNGR